MDLTTELSPGMLYRYVETRQRIDAEADNIANITSLLSLLEKCGDDRIDVDPIALGQVNQLLHHNVLNILEILDDFIYSVEAKSVLQKLEGFVE